MPTFANNLQIFKEFGVVEEVYHPVVKIKGLPSVHPGELVIFENNHQGQALLLGENSVEILLFSQEPVSVGMQVSRTGKQLSIYSGEHLKGTVIDPLGNQLIGQESKSQTPEKIPSTNSNQANIEHRIIDIPPLSITHRYQISEPLLTGVGIVDILLPLGRGQRELVVGDRKTGKTSFLLTAIKNQVNQGIIPIYVAIGKQAIDIEAVREWFEEQGILNKVVIVAANSQDSQSLIYLAPFTGMTIAEHFRDLGQDSLVILDDLSTHAKYYREISLLAKRFPGRDSYPGDIFFTHARLLERAGNFTHSSQGNVSISCLPVAETTENELSDYIVSNLIGITDGHLLFDSSEFIKGRRPAINPTSSVTRVGRQTQSLLHQNISQRLMTFITEINKSQKFSHFGAELTDTVKEILARGKILYSFFSQEPSHTIPLNLQLLFIIIIWAKWFENGTLPLSQQSDQEVEEVSVSAPKLQVPGQEQNVSELTTSAGLNMSEYVSKVIEQYNRNKQFNQWVNALIAIEDWFKVLEKLNTDKDKILSVIKK